MARTMALKQRDIEEIKAGIQRGDISSAIRALKTTQNAIDLQTFREQKLVFATRRPEEQTMMIRAFIAAADRLLSGTKLEHAHNYAQFVEVASKRQKQLTISSGEHRQALAHLSLAAIVEITAQVADEWLNRATMQYDEWFEAVRQANAGATMFELTELSSWYVHERNGTAIDINRAMARSLNYLSEATCSNRNRAMRRKLANPPASLAFKKLAQNASNWNCLQAAVDAVSYGDWVVSAIKHGNPTEIVFKFEDAKRERARAIGIRRHLVHEYYIKKRRSWVEDVLSTVVDEAFNSAVDYFLQQPDAPDEKVVLERAFEEVLSFLWLKILGPEDELLLVSSAPENNDRESTIIFYAVAVALRCYAGVDRYLSSISKTRQKKRGLVAKFHLSEIDNLFSRVNLPTAMYQQALAAQVRGLPLSRPLDLLDSPFIRLSHDTIGCLISMLGDWPNGIRPMLIKSGGLVRRFGKIWEDYVAGTLQNYGWSIWGQGVKLRERGQTITDVDVLAFKDGLLLVAQIKAMSASGRDTYSQWKAKLAIGKGANQARLAADVIIGRDCSLLSQYRDHDKVTCIQPLVITNVDIFSGWICNTVPVIGGGELMSLLRGATVRYVDKDHKVLGVQQFGRNSTLTGEEFLEFLRSPLSWRLSKEDDSVTLHDWADLGTVRLAIPRLGRP